MTRTTFFLVLCIAGSVAWAEVAHQRCDRLEAQAQAMEGNVLLLWRALPPLNPTVCCDSIAGVEYPVKPCRLVHSHFPSCFDGESCDLFPLGVPLELRGLATREPAIECGGGE